MLTAALVGIHDTSSLHSLTSALPAGLRPCCSDELTWGHWLADAIADVSHEMSMWGGKPWICAQCDVLLMSLQQLHIALLIDKDGA